MKLQIQSYNEINPSLQINQTWELLERTRILKIWDVLSILIENTSDLVKVIIAEEYKCEWENKVLITRRKLQIISWKRILKEVIWPKQYIIKEVSEKEANTIKKYTNSDMFEIYNFEYNSDLLIESNRLLTFLENTEINENNIQYIYFNIKKSFSTIIKILNNIWAFEIISRKMLSFLFFFDFEHNWLNIEQKIEKVENAILFLRDFAKIISNFEEEIHNWLNIDENIEHIEWENEIDIIIQKYTRLIEWTIAQTSYNLDLIINPNNTHYDDNEKIEFF